VRLWRCLLDLVDDIDRVRRGYVSREAVRRAVLREAAGGRTLMRNTRAELRAIPSQDALLARIRRPSGKGSAQVVQFEERRKTR